MCPAHLCVSLSGCAVLAHLSHRSFVSQILIIPDYYLSGSRGFEGLQAIQRLYGVDLVALVSYDQVSNSDVNNWSIAYWTIAGAYVAKGNRYDVATEQTLQHFDMALDQFATDVRAGTAPVNVLSRSGTPLGRGGAGAFDALDLLLLLPPVASRLWRSGAPGRLNAP